MKTTDKNAIKTLYEQTQLVGLRYVVEFWKFLLISSESEVLQIKILSTYHLNSFFKTPRLTQSAAKFATVPKTSREIVLHTSGRHGKPEVGVWGRAPRYGDRGDYRPLALFIISIKKTQETT